MKVKKIAAISSAIIFGASTAFAGMPNIVSAQTVSEEIIVPEAEKSIGITIDEKAFPDAAFRSYVEQNLDTEESSKGVLTEAEINKVTSISLLDLSVSDIKGIEFFTELQTLSISGSSLSSFTLKGLDKLEVLTIDLKKFYTINPDGTKAIDLSKVFAPALLEVFANENHPSFNKETNILTIPANENQTTLKADEVDGKKTIKWIFYTDVTQPNIYGVTFDSMGGSKIEDQLITHGKTASKPADPTKEGYIFKGWYLDKEFTKIYDFTAPVTRIMTLYALWEEEVIPNTPPTITAKDITLTVGDSFNPLNFASASDKEDGEIKLTNDNIIKNDVNTAKAGTYYVTYKVTDKAGASVEKTIKVTVNSKPEEPNTAPVIHAEDLTLTVGDKFDPLKKVTATDKEDGNLKLTKDNVIKNNVDTSKAGTYSVTYKVTDKNGASVEKTIKVTVKEKEDEKKKAPKTADMANVGLFGSMFAGSAGVLSLSLGRKRRKNNK